MKRVEEEEEEEELVAALADFAAKTKRRRIHSDETLLRKFLAAHAPQPLRTPSMYSFVGSDLDRINYRAPNVFATYAENAQHPMALFSHVFAGISIDPFVNGSLDKFAADVKAPKGHALTLLFSTHRAGSPEYVSELRKVCGDAEKGDELHRALVTYDWKCLAPGDVGQLLSTQLKLKNKIEQGAVGLSLSDRNNDNNNLTESAVLLPTAMGKKDKRKEILTPRFTESSPTKWTSASERQFRNIQRVADYKTEHNLPRQASSFRPVNELVATDAADADPQLCEIVDYYPVEALDQLVATENAQDYYYQTNQTDKNPTKQEFVKKLIQNRGVSPEMAKIMVNIKLG